MDNNNWPDPARPGVPTNPDWDGAYHWLSYESEEPGLYEWDGKYWKMGGGHAPMDYVVDHFTYIAQALTPAEVEARVATARKDALEEAAQWHDQQASEAQRLSDMKVSTLDSKVWGDYAQNHREYATAIRALKGEGDE
jgi:hypothetical protein